MIEPPKPGEQVKVTAPPPNEVRIASVGPQRGTGPEWVIVDTDGGRWAVVPRTDGPDGIRWYAASRVASGLDAMMAKDEAWMRADLAKNESYMKKHLDAAEADLRRRNLL